MLIQPSQADVRKFFCTVYAMALAGETLDAMQTIASGWIDQVATDRIRDIFAAARWIPIGGGATTARRKPRKTPKKVGRGIPRP